MLKAGDAHVVPGYTKYHMRNRWRWARPHAMPAIGRATRQAGIHGQTRPVGGYCTSYDACVVGVNGELPKSTNAYLQDVALNNKENVSSQSIE